MSLYNGEEEFAESFCLSDVDSASNEEILLEDYTYILIEFDLYYDHSYDHKCSYEFRFL